MKIGLALGSGSARGWSHIGIIEALAELDIHPEIVCGTSIGSIVGAAYATGNLGRLKQRVCALTKLNTASYFNFSMSIDGFVNKEKLRAFFADCVTPPGMLIEDLPVRYASVATEVSTGREYWLKKGPLEEAIWSSISFPVCSRPSFIMTAGCLTGAGQSRAYFRLPCAWGGHRPRRQPERRAHRAALRRKSRRK